MFRNIYGFGPCWVFLGSVNSQTFGTSNFPASLLHLTNLMFSLEIEYHYLWFEVCDSFFSANFVPLDALLNVFHIPSCLPDKYFTAVCAGSFVYLRLGYFVGKVLGWFHKSFEVGCSYYWKRRSNYVCLALASTKDRFSYIVELFSAVNSD